MTDAEYMSYCDKAIARLEKRITALEQQPPSPQDYGYQTLTANTAYLSPRVPVLEVPLKPAIDRPYPEYEYNPDRKQYQYTMSDGQTRFLFPEKVPSKVRALFEKDYNPNQEEDETQNQEARGDNLSVE